MDVFIHPHHAAGVRLEASQDETLTIIKDPVVSNVYLHGDTGAGFPVLPTVFTYLAAWGNAVVFKDGELFANPEGIEGIPSPLWEAHVMVTEGARLADGTVRTRDGAIYDQSAQADGLVEPMDLEVHLTWHDDRFPMRPDNYPPLFTFFYHLVFEDVTIQLVEGAHPPPVCQQAEEGGPGAHGRR